MSKNTGKNRGHENLIPFVKGKTGNPNGRPNGQRNYATIYREALKRIAEAKGKTPEEIEEMIEQVGLDKAMNGDYNFFKDVRDRIHGKPMQPQDVTSGGEPITGLTINVRKDN